MCQLLHFFTVYEITELKVVSLLPPSRASLLGLRGLELRANSLRSALCRTHFVIFIISLRAKAMGTKVSLPDIEGAPPPAAGHRLTHAQAEQRLISRLQLPRKLSAIVNNIKRCVRLFFWPAKMASTPPPRQESLFDDSDGENEKTKAGIPRTSLMSSKESWEIENGTDGEVEVWKGGVEDQMRDPLEVSLPTKTSARLYTTLQTGSPPKVVQGKGLHGISRPRKVPTEFM